MAFFGLKDGVATESIVLFCDFMKAQSVWLSGTPAGLKLHKPLADFYGLCLYRTAEIMHLHHSVLLGALSHVPVPFWICSPLLGVSAQLALCSDLLYIFQLPLTLVHTGFSYPNRIDTRQPPREIAGSHIITCLHLKCLILTWKLLRGQFSQEKRKQKKKSDIPVASHFGKDKKSKVSSPLSVCFVSSDRLGRRSAHGASDCWCSSLYTFVGPDANVTPLLLFFIGMPIGNRHPAVSSGLSYPSADLQSMHPSGPSSVHPFPLSW